MAECLRTRVQFPPSPPIQKAARFWVAFFIGGSGVEFKTLRVQKIAGSNF